MGKFMNIRKIIICGIIAGIISFIVGSMLYMNPLVSGIYEKYADYPGSKSMDSFGGVGNWLGLMLIGGIVSTIFMTVLYSYTEKGFGNIKAWKKGLVYGVLLWLAYKVPTAYYTWLMYTYPDALNVIEMFNGLVGGIVAGVVMAVLYEKLK